jgi:hypothetical protein
MFLNTETSWFHPITISGGKVEKRGKGKGKGKAIPLQVWTGPKGFRS